MSDEDAMKRELEKGVEAFNNGDYPTALEVLKPFAKTGSPTAQYCLGSMYARGDGVVKNYQIAYIWFNIASANGFEDIKMDRDTMEKNLSRTVLLESQRLAQQFLDSNYTDKECLKIIETGR